MNSKFLIWMAISITGLIIGFILLYDIQQERDSTNISPKSFNTESYSLIELQKKGQFANEQ